MSNINASETVVLGTLNHNPDLPAHLRGREIKLYKNSPIVLHQYGIISFGPNHQYESLGKIMFSEHDGDLPDIFEKTHLNSDDHWALRELWKRSEVLSRAAQLYEHGHTGISPDFQMGDEAMQNALEAALAVTVGQIWQVATRNAPAAQVKIEAKLTEYPFELEEIRHYKGTIRANSPEEAADIIKGNFDKGEYKPSCQHVEVAIKAKRPDAPDDDAPIKVNTGKAPSSLSELIALLQGIEGVKVLGVELGEDDPLNPENQTKH
jgi:hypothetical protein